VEGGGVGSRDRFGSCDQRAEQRGLILRFEKRDGLDGIWMDDDEVREFIEIEAMMSTLEAEEEAERLASELAAQLQISQQEQMDAARHSWSAYSRAPENAMRFGGRLHHLGSYYILGYQASQMCRANALFRPSLNQQGAMNAFGFRR
jgi:hypothetical protein